MTQKKQHTLAGRILRRTLGILLGSLSVSLVVTGLFVWLIRTDEDRILRRENKQLAAQYETLRQREQRVTDAIAYLQVRDHTRKPRRSKCTAAMISSPPSTPFRRAT